MGTTPSSPTQILLMGLDCAGKSRFSKWLAFRREMAEKRFSAFETYQIEWQDHKFCLWDMSGVEKHRPHWGEWDNNRADILFWMVDSADSSRFEESRSLLQSVLSQRRNLPLLLLISKQDLPHASSTDEIVRIFQLHDLGEERCWNVQSVQAPRSHDEKYFGLDESLEKAVQLLSEARKR